MVSAKLVEPTKSQKSTVICRRETSNSWVADFCTGITLTASNMGNAVPQLPQNLLRVELSTPHFVQNMRRLDFQKIVKT
jgi:hypothetical protein